MTGWDKVSVVMANGVVEWSRSAREVARVAFLYCQDSALAGRQSLARLHFGHVQIYWAWPTASFRLHIAKERTLAISLALTWTFLYISTLFFWTTASRHWFYIFLFVTKASSHLKSHLFLPIILEGNQFGSAANRRRRDFGSETVWETEIRRRDHCQVWHTPNRREGRTRCPGPHRQ